MQRGWRWGGGFWPRGTFRNASPPPAHHHHLQSKGVQSTGSGLERRFLLHPPAEALSPPSSFGGTIPAVHHPPEFKNGFIVRRAGCVSRQFVLKKIGSGKEERRAHFCLASGDTSCTFGILSLLLSLCLIPAGARRRENSCFSGWAYWFLERCGGRRQPWQSAAQKRRAGSVFRAQGKQDASRSSARSLKVGRGPWHRSPFRQPPLRRPQQDERTDAGWQRDASELLQRTACNPGCLAKGEWEKEEEEEEGGKEEEDAGRVPLPAL